jgi:hypothetical protein
MSHNPTDLYDLLLYFSTSHSVISQVATDHCEDSDLTTKRVNVLAVATGLNPLPHLPYSPDLTPGIYDMFGPLKAAMGVKKFRSDEDVHQAVYEWLHRQPQEYFLEEFIHFVNAEGTVLKFKKIYSFHLTHPHTLIQHSLLLKIQYQ